MKKTIISLLCLAGVGAYAQEDTSTAPVVVDPPLAPAPVVVDPPPAPPIVVTPPAPAPEKEYVVVPEDRPVPVVVVPVEKKRPVGLGFNVGGGVTQYFDGDARAAAQLGPAWTARLLVGSRSFIAGEAAYVGSTQQVAGLGSNLRGPQLLSNGVEGLLRVNLTRAAVQPFIGAGLGYKHYNVVNSTQEALSDVTDSANVGYMPAAAGLSVRVAGLMLDGRFGVDVPFTRPAVRTVDHDTEATSWNLTGNVGWEF